MTCRPVKPTRPERRTASPNSLGSLDIPLVIPRDPEQQQIALQRLAESLRSMAQSIQMQQASPFRLPPLTGQLSFGQVTQVQGAAGETLVLQLPRPDTANAGQILGLYRTNGTGTIALSAPSRTPPGATSPDGLVNGEAQFELPDAAGLALVYHDGHGYAVLAPGVTDGELTAAIAGSGQGAPTGAQYFLATGAAGLNNARVPTNTATVVWDTTKDGYFSASVPSFTATTPGAVPPAGSASGTYLRFDGVFAPIPGGGAGATPTNAPYWLATGVVGLDNARVPTGSPGIRINYGSGVPSGAVVIEPNPTTWEATQGGVVRFNNQGDFTVNSAGVVTLGNANDTTGVAARTTGDFDAVIGDDFLLVATGASGAWTQTIRGNITQTSLAGSLIVDVANDISLTSDDDFLFNVGDDWTVVATGPSSQWNATFQSSVNTTSRVGNITFTAEAGDFRATVGDDILLVATGTTGVFTVTTQGAQTFDAGGAIALGDATRTDSITLATAGDANLSPGGALNLGDASLTDNVFVKTPGDFDVVVGDDFNLVATGPSGAYLSRSRSFTQLQAGASIQLLSGSGVSSASLGADDIGLAASGDGYWETGGATTIATAGDISLVATGAAGNVVNKAAGYALDIQAGAMAFSSSAIVTNTDTGSQTAWDPGVGTATIWRWDGASGATIRGIAAPAAGRGAWFFGFNVSGSVLEFNDEDAAASAADRIQTSTGANIGANPQGFFWGWYDHESSRWRVTVLD